MATQPQSLFAASREAAQKIMEDQREAQVLRYETTEDARIRSQLSQQGVIDEYIDRYLEGYHIVQRVRQNLRLS